MRVTLLNDTSHNTNWGCAGTMTGLKTTLAGLCDEGSIESIDLRPLPFRKAKYLRILAQRRLVNCLLDRDCSVDRLSSALKSLNYKFSGNRLPDRLYLNGEGGIHSRSGHLARFLGIADLYKKLGVEVYAVNQSVDLKAGSNQAELVRSVYNRFDYISVREPCSLRLLEQIGVEHAELVPDAAFSLPPVKGDEVPTKTAGFQMPERYICLTGASDLNARSSRKILPVFNSIREGTGLPVIMLASTKTDKALARSLKKRNPDMMVITDAVDYITVMAVIARSEMLVGGRFHLAIFAALHGTPVVPFEGNTHKIKGLVELLSYPISSIDWKEKELYPAQIKNVYENREELGELLRLRSHDLAKQVSKLASLDLPG